MAKSNKAASGRPTRYRVEYIEMVKKLCKLGATNVDIADIIGISLATLHNWRNAHPKFLDAIKEAKEDHDTAIERSLAERAKGYSHDDVHISNYMGNVTITPITKHYPPDTKACMFWLSNRQPAKWRLQPGNDGGDDGEIVEVVKVEIVRRDASKRTD